MAINHLQGYAFAKKTGDTIYVFEGPHALADFMPVIAEGSDVPRMLKDRFADVINVRDFGAKGDGTTDDTESVSAALSYAASVDKPVLLDGQFLISSLTIPDGLKIFGYPQFIDKGTQGEHSYVLTIGKNVVAEKLKLTLKNNNIYRWGLSVGNGCSIDRIEVTADSLFNSESVHLKGDNIYIGHIYVHNVQRGFTIGAYQDIDRTTGKTDDGREFYSGITVDSYLLQDMVQGIRIGRATHCRIGDGEIQAIPEDVERNPDNGYNGIYISGSSFCVVGDVKLDRILEHSIRIGGDDCGPEGSKKATHDIHFGRIISYRQGGSALKINPEINAKAYNITVGAITSVDAGIRTHSVNRRLSSLRISHCDSFSCDSVVSLTSDISVIGAGDGQYQPETDIVEITDSSNVYIRSVYADCVGRSLVSFNEENDVDEDIDSSDLTCKNIQIDGVSCFEKTAIGGWHALYIPSQMSMAVDNLKVFGVNTFGTNFSGFVSGTASTVTNASIQVVSSVGVNSIPGYFTISTISGNQCFVIARNIANEFDASDAMGSATAVVKGAQTNSGPGLGGAAMVYVRRSGYRPAGAIASMEGTTGGESGLAVLTATGTTASNALKATWTFDSVDSALAPYLDNDANLGASSKRIKNIFATTGSINTSDYRAKQNISNIADDLLKAWGKVGFKVFQFKDSVKEKGINARYHIGVIAQDVQTAFSEYGLDATRYGLFCHDQWPEQKVSVVVVDEPAVLAEDGSEISPERCHTETRVLSAGDLYGVRYEEALVLECAYLRNRLSKIETVLASHGITLGDE